MSIMSRGSEQSLRFTGASLFIFAISALCRSLPLYAVLDDPWVLLYLLERDALFGVKDQKLYRSG